MVFILLFRCSNDPCIETRLNPTRGKVKVLLAFEISGFFFGASPPYFFASDVAYKLHIIKKIFNLYIYSKRRQCMERNVPKR